MLAGVCLVALAILLGWNPLPPGPLAVALAFFAVMLAPGILALALFGVEPATFPEYSILAFVIGVGLVSLVGAPMLLLKQNIAGYTWALAVMITLLAVFAMARTLWFKPPAALPVQNDDEKEGDNAWLNRLYWLLFAGVTLAMAYVVWSSARPFVLADRTSYMGTIQGFIQGPHFFDRRPLWPTPQGITAGGLFLVWPLALAEVVRVANTDLGDSYLHIIPALLTGLSFCGVYSLGRQLFHRHRVAVLAVAIQALFLYTSLGSDASGSNFIWRLIEDKFLVIFILLPGVAWLIVRLLAGQGRGNLVALALAAAAMVLVHPLGIAEFAILFVSALVAVWAGLAPGARRRWLRRSLPIALLFALVLVAPLIQRSLYFIQGRVTNYLDLATVLSTPQQAQRLLIFSQARNLFIVAPSLFAHPLQILTLVCLPLLALFWRRSFAARFLFGWIGLIALATLVPGLTAVTAALISYVQIYRFVYMLPVAYVLAFVVAAGADWLASSMRPRYAHLSAVFPLLLLALMFPILNGDAVSGRTYFEDRLATAPVVGVDEYRVLESLRTQVPDRGLILVFATWARQRAIDNEIPSAVGQAYGGTIRDNAGMFDTIQDAFKTRRALEQQPLLTNSYLDISRLYDGIFFDDFFVVTENGSPLDLQLQLLPSAFSPIYESDVYHAYAQRTDRLTSFDRLAMLANQYLLADHSDQAQPLYDAVLQADPNNLLALIGRGKLALLEKQFDQAESYYQKAATLAPNTASVQPFQIELQKVRSRSRRGSG